VAYWCKKMPVRLYFDEPLTVPWLTGGTFSVILDPEDTVASLKSKIQLQTNIPITNQVAHTPLPDRYPWGQQQHTALVHHCRTPHWRTACIPQGIYSLF